MFENYPTVDTDFSALTPQEQREYFSENGFLVIPGVISQDQFSRIRQEITDSQWGEREERFESAPSVAGLTKNAAVGTAISEIYGPSHCFKSVYVCAPPLGVSNGAQRQHLHLDYGTEEYSGDTRNYAPSWVNVGFYLCDLTPERGPLWVVPRSHRRYNLIPDDNLEFLDSEAKMVLASAGDAIMFHCFTAHAGGFNFSTSPRAALFCSYRPDWTQRFVPASERDAIT
jgi:ectoine hydroxylase-related dioxygenase (phytanoyl-CoA dioxygenase family)